jgi:ribosomal protein S16
MFNPSREQVRDFFFETWRKYRSGEPLAGLETVALQIALLHPEYRAVLDDPEHFRDQEYFPELGETNPFLHMSLHMALEEQLSIDQPAGVVERFEKLVASTGDRHNALHEALECLAEMVWRAQRDNAPPDAVAYLENLDARSRK